MILIIIIIQILICIALYTLLERKIMASIQRRQGPNVVGLWGLLQPLADGGKLAFKHKITPKLAEHVIFNFAPVVILCTSLLSWFLIIQGHITTKNNYLLSYLFTPNRPESISPRKSLFKEFFDAFYIIVVFPGDIWERDPDKQIHFRDWHQASYKWWLCKKYFKSLYLKIDFEFLSKLLTFEYWKQLVNLYVDQICQIKETFYVNLNNWIQPNNTVSVSIFCILAISSLNVYSLILAGWSSNSKYAFFGSLRSGAQMISYEVAIGLTLLPVLLLSGCALSFKNISELTHIIYHWNLWFFVICFFIFVVSMLAETNRTPFDLTEAEAELVAGYNVEYSALTFAMFFLAEYSNMLIMSIMGSIFFFGSFYTILFVWQILVFIYIFVLIRATFPRYKYNELMDLGWKNFLPILLGFFTFVSFGLYWLDLQYYGI